MLGFLFGKKKKKHSVKKGKGRKPPARLIKLCKKYRIKVTKKVGKKRVYKSVTVLKKQLKRKIKVRKVRKVHKRRSRFGFGTGKNIKEFITELELYKNGRSNNIRAVLKGLYDFLQEENDYPEISINLEEAYKHAVHDMQPQHTSPIYSEKYKILGNLAGYLGVFKMCKYDPMDDYDDDSGCDPNKIVVKGLIIKLLTTVCGLKEGVDFFVNGTSFGKRRRTRRTRR